jgi:hypothetical protein
VGRTHGLIEENIPGSPKSGVSQDDLRLHGGTVVDRYCGGRCTPCRASQTSRVVSGHLFDRDISGTTWRHLGGRGLTASSRLSGGTRYNHAGNWDPATTDSPITSANASSLSADPSLRSNRVTSFTLV